MTEPGVGTNRYSYSFNDPVNLSDPNGNQTPQIDFVDLSLWAADQAIKTVIYYVSGQVKEDHYSRNETNVAPKTVSDANREESGFSKMPPEQSVFHQQGHDGEGNDFTGNQKYIDAYGNEAVYNSDGEPVTDSVNMPTKNLIVPGSLLENLGHVGVDILPYYVWGNTEDDPTYFSERVGRGFGFDGYTGDVNETYGERRERESPGRKGRNLGRPRPKPPTDTLEPVRLPEKGDE